MTRFKEQRKEGRRLLLSDSSAVSSSLVLVFSSFSGASSANPKYSAISSLYRIAAAPAEVTPTASRPSGLVEIATVKAPIAVVTEPIRTGSFAVINAVATIPVNLARWSTNKIKHRPCLR